MADSLPECEAWIEIEMIFFNVRNEFKMIDHRRGFAFFFHVSTTNLMENN